MRAKGERSIAAGGGISGIALTGDNNTLIHIEPAAMVPPEAFAPASLVEAPAALSNLPLRSTLFVGRTQVAKRLDSFLEARGGVVVVHGLGGMGKSTLAAHWAATRASGHNPIWWITADSPEGVNAGLAAFAVALQPVLADALSSEALTERALQWLAAHTCWLLILDNVNDPKEVAPLLGRVPGGHVLITTRRATGWQGIATPVGLDVLEPDEAVDLLTRFATDAEDRFSDGADELCRELGYLPLAIEQAGAFLAETGTGPRDYLELLARYPAQMYENAATGVPVERTIARIWQVTLERLSDQPLAAGLLRIMAWFAPADIPGASLRVSQILPHSLARSAAWPPTACSPSIKRTRPSLCTGSFKPSTESPIPPMRTAPEVQSTLHGARARPC